VLAHAEPEPSGLAHEAVFGPAVARLRAAGATRVRERVLVGPPAAAIVEAAAYERADLVALATHGRLGLERLWLGSVAEEVARACAGLGAPFFWATVPEVYFWDGWQTVEETNTSGVVQKRYVWSEGIDEILKATLPDAADIDGDTITAEQVDLYYHHNSLGSVVAVTDAAGTVKESYRYSAFGTPTIYSAAGSVISTTAVKQPFMFTGARYDFEEGSGLYQMRFRYYDPVVGRFVSRDPLGLWGDPSQNGNGQAYCGHDPVNRTDRHGTQDATSSGWSVDAEGVEDHPNEARFKKFTSTETGGGVEVTTKFTFKWIASVPFPLPYGDKGDGWCPYLLYPLSGYSVVATKEVIYSGPNGIIRRELYDYTTSPPHVTIDTYETDPAGKMTKHSSYENGRLVYEEAWKEGGRTVTDFGTDGSRSRETHYPNPLPHEDELSQEPDWMTVYEPIPGDAEAQMSREYTVEDGQLVPFGQTDPSGEPKPRVVPAPAPRTGGPPPPPAKPGGKR
jgi:RHS repeat-associated protein